MLMATMPAPRPVPNTLWKAREGMVPAISEETSVHMPVHMTTRPDMVQITRPETITSNTPQKPWRTGWSVVAAAWPAAAEPMPASVE